LTISLELDAMIPSAPRIALSMDRALVVDA
jgi:hypothetical protein